MNGTQITGTSFFNDISRPELTPAENPRRPATGLMHPNKVASDLWLTQAEKREILASWASDVRAVPDAPALRQLDNGAVVRIDDVLRALKSLNVTTHPLLGILTIGGMKVQLDRVTVGLVHRIL